MYTHWNIILLGLYWVATVSSAPIQIEKRAIDASLLDQLYYYSQWAAAAYCLGNNNSPGTKILCPQGNCPRVEAENTNTLTEFQNSLATDVTGFVATDTTASLIVISFRGSRSVRNWLTDFSFPVIMTSICQDCFASTGFYASWLESQTGVFTALDAARAQYPSYRIVVTGHSLGGALATIAVGALRSNGTSVDMYTYGAPKVGLRGIAEYISQTNMGSNFRVTHVNDPVPRMPPLLAGYQHVSPEYYITSGNDVKPTVNDIAVYSGITNTQGNEKDLGFDVASHTHYFGHTSGCEGVENLLF